MKVNFESKNHSKCFWIGQRLTGLSLTHFSPVSHFYTPWKRQELKVFDGWGTAFNFLPKITFWAALVGSGLKLIFHWKAHSLVFALSLLQKKSVLLNTTLIFLFFYAFPWNKWMTKTMSKIFKNHTQVSWWMLPIFFHKFQKYSKGLQCWPNARLCNTAHMWGSYIHQICFTST